MAAYGLNISQPDLFGGGDAPHEDVPPAVPPVAEGRRISVQDMVRLDALWILLGRSQFRSRFRLGTVERAYYRARGVAVIRQHAQAFVRDRLSAATPTKDGHQTPMRGHPVFIAQHATATCCRGCLRKWHGIEGGQPLNKTEQDYIIMVLMAWLRRQENYEEA